MTTMHCSCIDPSPRTLRESARSLVRCVFEEVAEELPPALPDLEPLRERPPGVWLHLLPDRRSGFEAAALTVARWDDALNRSHWHLECAYHNGYDLQTWSPDAHRWQHLSELSLERVVPAGHFLIRKRAGASPDTVVLCHCGAVGTASQLAWMGQICGPCHDREQEGEPPLVPFVPSIEQTVHLADAEGWITQSGATVWSCTVEGEPIWTCDAEGLPFLTGTRDLLVWSQHREIRCVEGRTGTELARWITRQPILHALVLDAQTVLTVHATQLEWWQIGQPMPQRIVRIHDHASDQPVLDANRRAILVPTTAGIECFGLEGERLTSLITHPSVPIHQVVPLSASRILGIQRSDDRYRLFVWEVDLFNAKEALVLPVTIQERTCMGVGRAMYLERAGLLLFPRGNQLEALVVGTWETVCVLDFGLFAPVVLPVGPDHLLIDRINERLLVSWRDLLT